MLLKTLSVHLRRGKELWFILFCHDCIKSNRLAASSVRSSCSIQLWALPDLCHEHSSFPLPFLQCSFQRLLNKINFSLPLPLMLSNFSLPWLMYPILQGYSCLHWNQLLVWSAFLKSRLMRKVILLNIGNKINLIKGTCLVSWELAFYKSVLYYIGLRFNIHFPGTLIYIFVLFLLRVQPGES